MNETIMATAVVKVSIKISKEDPTKCGGDCPFVKLNWSDKNSGCILFGCPLDIKAGDISVLPHRCPECLTAFPTG